MEIYILLLIRFVKKYAKNFDNNDYVVNFIFIKIS